MFDLKCRLCMKNKLFLYFFISLALHMLLLQVPEGNKKSLLKREVLIFSERVSRKTLRERSANFSLGKFDAALEETIRTSLPIPFYPPLAIQLKQEGIGIVKVKISKDGTVKEISFKQSTGHELLDQSILEAIKNWTPPLTTMTWLELPPFHFKLKEYSQRKRVSVSP